MQSEGIYHTNSTESNERVAIVMHIRSTFYI